MKKWVFLVLAYTTIMSVCALQQYNQIEVIIIDAAHGGEDFGAVKNHIINNEAVTLSEKEITLKIALLLKEKISKAFPNKKVIMTRENDELISFAQRSANARDLRNMGKAGETLFISIHANFSYDQNKRGHQILYTRNEDALLAEIISKEFEKVFGNDSPVNKISQQDIFLGFSNAMMPYIVVETGFISNREDSLILCSDEGLEKYSNALLQGIATYMSLLAINNLALKSAGTKKRI
jgi:N-acetylmuramoyl-L-alanine amidase